MDKTNSKPVSKKDSKTNSKTNSKPFFDRRVFVEGVRDGIPIGLGYFAVAFSLGIAARSAGPDTLPGISHQHFKQRVRRSVCRILHDGLRRLLF